MIVQIVARGGCCTAETFDVAKAEHFSVASHSLSVVNGFRLLHARFAG